MRKQPDPTVLRWFTTQSPQAVAITTITVAELRFGIEAMHEGKRRTALDAVVTEMLAEDFRDAILPFNAAAGEAYGALGARLRKIGEPTGQNDTMIAAIVSVADATLVTRNVRHFAACGIEVVDPFEG